MPWTNGCIRGYPLPAGNGYGQSFLSMVDIGYGFGYGILVMGMDVQSADSLSVDIFTSDSDPQNPIFDQA
jgi:hypothetical protein